MRRMREVRGGLPAWRFRDGRAKGARRPAGFLHGMRRVRVELPGGGDQGQRGRGLRGGHHHELVHRQGADLRMFGRWRVLLTGLETTPGLKNSGFQFHWHYAILMRMVNPFKTGRNINARKFNEQQEVQS
jgi:hypothetical protein